MTAWVDAVADVQATAERPPDMPHDAHWFGRMMMFASAGKESSAKDRFVVLEKNGNMTWYPTPESYQHDKDLGAITVFQASFKTYEAMKLKDTSGFKLTLWTLQDTFWGYFATEEARDEFKRGLDLAVASALAPPLYPKGSLFCGYAGKHRTSGKTGTSHRFFILSQNGNLSWYTQLPDQQTKAKGEVSLVGLVKAAVAEPGPEVRDFELHVSKTVQIAKPVTDDSRAEMNAVVMEDIVATVIKMFAATAALRDEWIAAINAVNDPAARAMRSKSAPKPAVRSPRNRKSKESLGVRSAGARIGVKSPEKLRRSVGAQSLAGGIKSPERRRPDATSPTRPWSPPRHGVRSPERRPDVTSPTRRREPGSRKVPPPAPY